MHVVYFLLFLECARALLTTGPRSTWTSQRMAGLVRGQKPLNLLVEDDGPKLTMAEDNDKPRVLVQSLDDLETKARASTPGAGQSSGSSRSSSSFKSSVLDEDIEAKKNKKKTATFGSLSIEDLKGRAVKNDGPMRSWADLPKRTEDLNGINPVTTILFSAFPAVVSFLLANLSTFLAQNFAVQYLNSELYPVQRLAIVIRNLVVGLITLGGGFCGIIAVGLLALGVTVAVGVAKGELDPNKDNATGNVL